jgi:hypothetical protein
MSGPDGRAAFGAGLVALGILSLFLGWGGLLGAQPLSAQLPYLVSGGLGGLALCGIGAVVLAERGFARDRDRLERVEAVIRHRNGSYPEDAGTSLRRNGGAS